MAEVGATIAARLVVDAKGFQSGLNTASKAADGFEKKMKSWGQSMQKVGGIMTAAITVPLAALTVSAVKGASDVQEAVGKSTMLFGDYTKDIVKWSETTADAFGISKKNALEASTSFGNFFTTAGLATSASSDMSMSLVELAGDMAAFNNVGTDQVLQDIQSGLAGSTETLRKYGVDLRITTLDQAAMNMGFKDTYSELSRSDQMLVTYNALMKQTAVQQGAAAEQSGGLAMQIEILKAKWSDLMVLLGEKVLPMATDLAGKAIDLMDGFNNLNPAVQNFIFALGGIAMVAGPALMVLGSLASSIGSITALFGGGAAVGGAAAGGAALGGGLIGLLESAQVGMYLFTTGVGGATTAVLGVVAAIGLALVKLSEWNERTGTFAVFHEEQMKWVETSTNNASSTILNANIANTVSYGQLDNAVHDSAVNWVGYQEAMAKSTSGMAGSVSSSAAGLANSVTLSLNQMNESMASSISLMEAMDLLAAGTLTKAISAGRSAVSSLYVAANAKGTTTTDTIMTPYGPVDADAVDASLLGSAHYALMNGLGNSFFDVVGDSIADTITNTIKIYDPYTGPHDGSGTSYGGGSSGGGSSDGGGYSGTGVAFLEFPLTKDWGEELLEVVKDIRNILSLGKTYSTDAVGDPIGLLEAFRAKGDR